MAPRAKLAKTQDGKPRQEDLYETEVLGRKVMVATMRISLNDLIVDDKYQRPLNEGRARRYAVEWSDALAGLVTVSNRANGKYALLDGQHRSRAARIRAFDKIWCEAFFDLTPREEAHIFRERNRRRVGTNSIDDFRAGWAEGDPQVRRILHALSELGLSIGYGANDTKTYQSVTTLIALDEWGVLKRTLELIRATWPDLVRAKERNVLLATGEIVWSFKNQLDDKRWARLMEAKPLNAWVGDAKSLRASLGRREWEHLARIMLKAYNKGLSKKLAENDLRIPQTKSGVKGANR